MVDGLIWCLYWIAVLRWFVGCLDANLFILVLAYLIVYCVCYFVIVLVWIIIYMLFVNAVLYLLF